MTLFKQMALMLSIFLIIILSTVLVLNFNNANENIQKKLFENAKNTASSLSLSLGSANGDIVMMSTMINANFDSGNYQHISLIDVNGKTLYKRESNNTEIDAPKWFIKLFNIDAPVANASVSAGWSPIGMLHVQSDVNFAHTQLYKILKNLFISFAILAIVGLVILNLILHTVLKPLKQVFHQAEAISNNEFIIQKDIPSTKEFKNVVIAMNTMVYKVKTMFDRGNEELKRQKELEYIDQGTKLSNRKFFINKLPEYLKDDAYSKTGVNMMIAINGIAEANAKIGHSNVDDLFAEISKIFTNHTNSYFNSIVARMNGTEFSILLPDCSLKDVLILAQDIENAVNNTISNTELNPSVTYISIGLYEYNYKQTAKQLLSFSDNSLAQAKFNKKIHIEHSDTVAEVMGKDAWREIINNAIAENGFMLAPKKVINTKTKEDIYNELRISMIDNLVTYPFEQFMASANQTKQSLDIYYKVIEMMLAHPDRNLQGSTCSFKLPYDFLDSIDTYEYVSKLFSKYKNKLPYKLIIEIPDKLVSNNLELAKLYKTLFQSYNFELALFEFIGENNDFKYLQELRPSYIKAQSKYFLNLNEQSLKAFKLISDSIGILLIATEVKDNQIIKELEEKGITTIQGDVVNTL